jgi:hypothetical protein
MSLHTKRDVKTFSDRLHNPVDPPETFGEWIRRGAPTEESLNYLDYLLIILKFIANWVGTYYLIYVPTSSSIGSCLLFFLSKSMALYWGAGFRAH